MIASLGTGGIALLSAGIVALGGIIAATITACSSVIKDSREFQRNLIDRLLNREEAILTPLVSSSENMQDSIKVIGIGMNDLLAALRVEEALRQKGRGE